MTLLRLSGFSICWQTCRSLLLPLLPFGVITLVLLIYLRILSFMLILNISRLIIILYAIRLWRKRFRFILSPLRINLQMFLLSRFLLLFLLLFTSSFMSIFHPRGWGQWRREGGLQGPQPLQGNAPPFVNIYKFNKNNWNFFLAPLNYNLPPLNFFSLLCLWLRGHIYDYSSVVISTLIILYFPTYINRKC